MFGGNFTENNSLFQNNYGLMGGTMFTTEIAVADIRNCLFIKQFTDLGGGAFGITDHSKFVFKNTTFIVFYFVHIIYKYSYSYHIELFL